MTESSSLTRSTAFAIVVSTIVGGAFYIAGKKIDARTHNDQPSTINVAGEGKVFTSPDIAKFSVGMQTGRKQTAAAAMETLKSTMDSVLKAVRAQGIADKDIRTENFWLNPAYEWTGTQQVPRGFEATQSVTVKVRDLDKVSDVLGAATAAGANSAGSVMFTVDDPEAKRAEARKQAIEDAQAKAEILAEQLGVRLGKIVSFSEGYGSPISPMYDRVSNGIGGGMAEQALELPAGEQEIAVSVNITYEIY